MHTQARCLGEVTMEGYEKCSYSKIALRVDEYLPGTVMIGPLHEDSGGIWTDPNYGPYFDLLVPLNRYLITISARQLRQNGGAVYTFTGPYLGTAYMHHSRMAVDEGTRVRVVESLRVELGIEKGAFKFRFSGVAGPVDPTETIGDIAVEKQSVTFNVCCHVTEESLPIVFRTSSKLEILHNILKMPTE